MKRDKNLHRGNGSWVEGGHEGDVAVEVIVAQQAGKLLRDSLQQQQTVLTIYLELHKAVERKTKQMQNKEI